MSEVEIIQKISLKQAELEKKKAEKAGVEVVSAIEKEIQDLIESLPRVEKVRSKQAFLDECAG